MQVSCVIPCHGGQERLDKTLATLQAQTRPFDEIIVVDDGSNEKIRVPLGVDLLRINRPPVYRGSSAAKNHGARHASGEWLVFSDNDILHMPDALERSLLCVKRLGRDDVLVNVLSMALKPDTLDSIKWEPTADRMEALCKIVDWFGLDKKVAGGEVLFSEQHFGLIRRDYFNSLGGYDESGFPSWGYNNQDLTIRVKKAGGLATSKVFRRDGTVLRCFHMHCPDPRDSITAKREFRAKYGEFYNHDMLVRSHAV